MSIKIGDRCPNFEGINQHGKKISASDYLMKKNLVVFFYPKDNTSGCIAEVCSFRDTYEDFLALNTEVIGLSSDSVNSHQHFASKHHLNFNIIADKGGVIRKTFGVKGKFFGLIPGRVTYIIDKNGIVQNIFENLFEAELHIKNAMEIIASIDK